MRAPWYPRLLRTRLLLAFVAVGVVPLLLLAAFFTVFSIDYVTRAYNERALQHIVPISDDIQKLLLRYRHLAYVLSREEVIIDVLSRSRQPDRATSLQVYRLLYRSLAGNLDHAALHIASRTRTPSLSTHMFPAAYTPVNPQEGIYRLADATPERTVLYTQSYVNEKGQVVNFSLAKCICTGDGSPLGYLIIDLFKSYLADAIRDRNNRFFSEIVVTDNHAYYAVDLLHAENDGDFGGIPYLSRVDRSTRGASVIGDLVVSRVPILDGTLTVIGSLPTQTSLEGVGELVAVTAWIVLAAAALSIAVAVLMARHISSPIHQLSAAMQRVEGGDLSVTTSTQRQDEIGLLFRGFNRMVHEIGELLEKTVQEQEALRVAEIKSLQAQINPHFLYNTLGTIKSIAKLHSIPEIVTITTELGRLLRKNIDIGSGTISVAESIALIRSFASIHDARHPGRYRVHIDVEERALSQTIPALLLQPLVENAYTHGLEKKIGPGTLTITGRIRRGELEFTITDDGAGFGGARIDHPEDHRERTDSGGSAGNGGHMGAGNHIGLANVDRRLRLLYGDSYGLQIESAPNRGCRVTLRIPLPEKGDS